MLLSCALIEEAATEVRLLRYASANACAHAAAPLAEGAWQAMSSTCEFGGTVTETSPLSFRGLSGLFSCLAAIVATLVDVTSCASVSRLTVPWVRLLAS